MLAMWVDCKTPLRNLTNFNFFVKYCWQLICLLSFNYNVIQEWGSDAHFTVFRPQQNGHTFGLISQILWVPSPSLAQFFLNFCRRWGTLTPNTTWRIAKITDINCVQTREVNLRTRPQWRSQRGRMRMAKFHPFPFRTHGNHFRSELSSIATFRCQNSMKINRLHFWRAHTGPAGPNFMHLGPIPGSIRPLQGRKWVLRNLSGQKRLFFIFGRGPPDQRALHG